MGEIKEAVALSETRLQARIHSSESKLQSMFTQWLFRAVQLVLGVVLVSVAAVVFPKVTEGVGSRNHAAGRKGKESHALAR